MQQRFAMLAITGILALSACGQTNTPAATATTPVATTPTTPTTPVATTPTPPKVQQVDGCATITVDLEGIAAVGGAVTAPVMVLDSTGAQVFSGTATDLVALSQTFPAGTYSVKAGTIQGYAASNSPQSVTLDCDANKAKTVVLQFKTAAATQAKVASLTFAAQDPVTDGDLQDLPGNKENNTNKNVMIYASQTEEASLVTMFVKDASGAPVAGAAVNVQVDSPSVAIIGGHVRGMGSPVTTQALATQAVAYSDDQGVVRFTAYATSAPSTGTPVKFVVSATNDGGAALAEFKMFYINMSHLYYQGDTNFGQVGGPIASKQRLGGSVGAFENNWIDPAQRTHAFNTVAYAKQPQGGSSTVGGEGPFPGYMAYSVSGASASRVFLTTDPNGNSGGSSLNSSGTTYLKTRDDVKATDLGLNVQVKADYHYVVGYGSSRYDFLLKSYLFDKSFTGTILDISKTGPDIQTWTGYDRSATPSHDAYRPDDVTLLPALDPNKLTPSTLDDFTVGKTYDYTITVRNTGKTVARNVIARDVLPAELGFVQGSVSVSKNGAAVANSSLLATYNAQRHAFNLAFTGAASIGELQPGEAFVITFKVYPRQKPGYAWNDNNRDGVSDPLNTANPTGFYGENAPRTTLYEDPYMIKNRAKASAENAFEVDAYKDIYVVRPELFISKQVRKSVVFTNQPITFDIGVYNLDRAFADPNSEVQAGYADLKTRFPDQYANEGFAYRPRLEDSYGYNLDFVNAYDAAGDRITTFEQNGNNGLAINLPEVLKVGSQYKLSTVFQAENSVRGPSGRDSAGRAANYNCVRLYAWNLNQLAPANYDSGLELASKITAQAQTAVFPPLAYQYEGYDRGLGFVNLDGSTGNFVTTERGIDRNGRNYLISCDYVQVLDKPSFDLGLFDAARGSSAAAALTDYTVNPKRLTDAQDIPQNSYFEYDFSYTNESADDAHNVRSSMTLPTFASLNDLGVVYTHNGVKTNYSMLQVLAGVTLSNGETLTGTRSGNVVTMRVSTMNAKDTLFAQFVMYANQAGSGKAASTLDWDENTNGSPLTEDEFTKVTLR
ncbi:DUF11 domain-containing protein [Deinococcus sp.]|uniref:DUF11 domain-containing protein n=1 Tax=Deinococcus sp. TaxID=47478 RepID=UPI003C799128